MLVSVDIDRGIVTLYGASVVTMPIIRYNQLRPLLTGKVVQYVQEVEEVVGDEVLDLLATLAADPNLPRAQMPAAQRPEAERSEPIDADGRQWMYATGSGYMNIPAVRMRFDGPADFKDLAKLGYDIFEREPLLEELRRKKKLRVVGTSEMKRLKQAAAVAQAGREDMSMRNSDGSSIIVDTSGGRIKNQADMSQQFEEVTSTDPAENFMSEEERLINQFGFGRKEEDEGTVEDAGGPSEQEIRGT